MTTYERIYKHQDKRCFYCNEKIKITEMEKEHVFPKSKGGRGIKNKVLSCHFCNNIKSNLNISEFISKINTMVLYDNINKNKLGNILIKLELLQNGLKIRENMHKKALYKTNDINIKPMKNLTKCGEN